MVLTMDPHGCDVEMEASLSSASWHPNEDARASIVLLTFNRRVELLRTLARLTALPERPPIIAVDNGSTDGSAEAVAACFPRVLLIKLPRNLGAAGRNWGVAAARTPYVAFCDDDTCWAPGSIARGVEILDRHASLAVVCARILVGERGHLDPVSHCMANSPLSAPGLPGRAIVGFMAGASLMRVCAFRQVGGYCARLFIGCEEELMALDLAEHGWRMLYCDELIVRHRPSSIRHAPTRSALAARNAFWIACLRLPWAEVARRSAAIATARGPRLRTIWQTLLGLRWALSGRKVVSREVQRMRALVQAQERARFAPLMAAWLRRMWERWHVSSQ
jgi:GT2 family glycosyltransferase